MAIPRIRLQLAAQIKKLRRKANLSQEEAAERADMSVRYYQRLESRVPKAIKIDTLERVAKALKTKPSKLLDF